MTVQLLRLFVVTSLMFIVGCAEVDLYSDLPEKEINEMMAILRDNGISCTKVAGEEKMWSVTVDNARYADAVTILNDLGRPRKRRPTMDELFPKTGFTSSPFEQQVRLTYGLAQSLEETISMLPGGVVDADVHLVLPINNTFGESSQVSRANVMVIHRRGADIQNSMPAIKSIVMGAVDGLEEDKVTVDFVEADESLSQIRASRDVPPDTMTNVLSIRVAKTSASRLMAMLGVSAASLVIGLVLTVVSFRRQRTSTA